MYKMAKSFLWGWNILAPEKKKRVTKFVLEAYWDGYEFFYKKILLQKLLQIISLQKKKSDQF